MEEVNKEKTIDDVIWDLEVVGDNQELPDQESYDNIWGAVEFLRDYKTKNFQEQYDEEHDKYLRLAADFQNYKNRMNRERAEWINGASKDILVDILPIIDDYERAIDKMEDGCVKDGLLLILKRMEKLLDDEGCTVIDVKVGDKFDPNTCDAISVFNVNDETDIDKIMFVTKKGYMLNGKILRHPEVIVGGKTEKEG